MSLSALHIPFPCPSLVRHKPFPQLTVQVRESIREFLQVQDVVVIFVLVLHQIGHKAGGVQYLMARIPEWSREKATQKEERNGSGNEICLPGSHHRNSL